MKITPNKTQKQAIRHTGSPLLIIAGAGTGKTTVITERVKWLIDKIKLNPEEILALTFTQKAAQEMEERIDIALPLGYSQLWISTFHSFCDKVLRNEAIHIGLDPDFKLLTEAESILFLKSHFFKLKLRYFRPASNPNKFLGGILTHFSRLQDEDVSPAQYLKFAKNQAKKTDTKAEIAEAAKTLELAGAFAEYQRLKKKEGIMDFADLITNTLELFRNRPNLRADYQKKFRHLLVDEFQDTNAAQYELVKILAPPKKDTPLTVTGDDSQSIYKFRGAAVSNILKFIDDYRSAKTIVLTSNYRSTQIILDHSYQLIQHNNPDTLEVKMGISKNLVSRFGGRQKPVAFFWQERVEDEAGAVAEEIQKLTGGKAACRWRDIAILLRANNHAEPFIRELGRQGIPCQFLGPGQLFRRPEVKNLIAYIKFLNNPDNDIALFKVLSIQNFQISARDLAFIRSFAKKHLLSLFEALETMGKNNEDLPRVSPKTKKQADRFVTMVHRHLGLVSRQTGGQILYYFLQDSGLLKTLQSPETEKEQQKALNISKFFDKIKSFENQNPEAGLLELDSWITLKLEMGESPLAAEIDWTENNAVNILTVHSSKGLEFPVVFLANLVNQRFPTNRRQEQLPIPRTLIKEILPQGDPHQQEERRLFYVGMTRAKKRLYFTGACFYGGGKRSKKPSLFVLEALGEKTVEKTLRQTKTKQRQLSFLGWEEAEERAGLPTNPPVSQLSYSRLDAFHICPRQYQYKYIIRLPTPASASQSLGNAVHKTLKQFYQKQARESQKLPLRTIIDLLEKNWRSEGFSSKEHQKQGKKQAVKMIKQFYQKGFRFENIGNVAGLEEPFWLKISPALKIGGRIDRIDNIGEGKIEVIDYKTGSRTDDQKAVDRNDQLTTYALAISSIKTLPFWRPVEKIVLSLYFLESGVKLSSSRTEDQVKKIKEKFIQTAREIEKNHFPPQPAKPFPCNYCEFKLLCEAWK